LKMNCRELKYEVYNVGAIDWDRRLFDSLIPLPDGTSYNAYLVKGSEKTALIDTVKPEMAQNLLHQLNDLGVNRIDYVISNHAEQDHSGSLPLVLNKYPGAKVVSTARCKGILIDLLGIAEDKFITVEDRQTISLGSRTLEFIHAPWVHWPETMFTYLREEQILFTCDFLGSHIATSDLFVADEGQVAEASKRYFAEIMMPFSNIIKNNLEKIKGLEIKIIAPSHGPAHDRPSFILDLYRSWVYDAPGNIVVLPYVSMHGSTEKMVDYLVEALIRTGVTVKQFDLSVTDIGKLAMSFVDAATVVIGTPTVLAGPHPATVYAAYLANALRPPSVKFVSIIGSYAWGGKTVDTLSGMLSNLKVEVIEPVLCKGLPREADFKALDTLAEKIAQRHKDNNFV
jgi:flavorubredoxin